MKWTNGRNLIMSDKDRIADDICRSLSKELSVDDYKSRSIIRDTISNELYKYDLFEDYEGTEKSIFWRLALILWMPAHFLVLVPYCCFKWLFGYGWYLKSDSILSRFHRRVTKNL